MKRDLLLPCRNRCEHPDVTIVPVDAKVAMRCQLGVSQPLAAQVSYDQTTAKMKE